MDKTMILYRGSLKSCNYHCSYCPFSKHRGLQGEYDRDRQQWERFVESIFRRTQNGWKPGALMIVPYGEALIHSWYWEGLGRLAVLKSMEALGAQTNLSFPIEQSLDLYQKAGGRKEKLRLWATFHPEMTEAKVFAQRCECLLKEGVTLCAGAVGVPENLQNIRLLRQYLPKEIYLWINKMDGLKRPYTQKEQADFAEIDPLFLRELIPVKAAPCRCRGRFFVEGDGKIRSCNISPVRKENWYDLEGENGPDAYTCLALESVCSRKQCSCYLAYGGRSDAMNQILFGDYPLFRIPRNPKAVFLDIDGTLLLKEEQTDPIKTGRQRQNTGRLPEQTKRELELLRNQGTKLFFATSLPCEIAARRCREIWHLFEGGVFGGGGYVVGQGQEGVREKLYPINETYHQTLKELGESLGCRVLIYKKEALAYKITFLRPGKKGWKAKEGEEAVRQCQERCEKQVRGFLEGQCLEIVAAGAGKGEGVRVLCQWLGISPADAAAAGDSPEDQERLRMCKNFPV